MKKMKRLGCLLLALVMAASLWGCASSNGPADSTTQAPQQTTVPDETHDHTENTDPDVELGKDPVAPLPGTLTGEEAVTTQLRVTGVNSGWKNAFNNDLGCFALASSLDELQALVGRSSVLAELDLSAYGEVFFAKNRLVLIPRSSSSGSARFQAVVNENNGLLHIMLKGQMPEVGTADMAEWLVLVQLPRAKYGEDLSITVPAAGGDSTGTVSR